MNENKNAVLLKLNKEAQVQALRELGFTEVTNSTPLSEIAEYMRWAGGLRDIRLAAFHREQQMTVALTKEEWASMSSNIRTKYVKVGLWIRCNRTEFIIAAEDCKNSAGTYTFKWGGYGVDLRGVTNYSTGSVGLFDVKTGEEDTLAAITQLNGYTDSQNITGAPACEAAYYYTVNNDVDADGNPNRQWYLPSISQLWLIAKYRTQIHEAFAVFFSSASYFSAEYYWSSTESSSSNSWHLNMYYGIMYINNRNNSDRCRPVCSVPSLANKP